MQDGSQFTLRLMDLLAPNLPMGQARAKLTDRLQDSYHIPEEHLRMCARTLSANADLVDTEYAKEQQSHWNDIANDVASETRISFLAPCMRLRWRYVVSHAAYRGANRYRALEEIDTGVGLKKVKTCNACKKETEKLVCSQYVPLPMYAYVSSHDTSSDAKLW